MTQTNWRSTAALLFQQNDGDIATKLDNFPKYVHRKRLKDFIVKYELFQRIINVNGSIVECGVGYGGGLMAWAQISEILEPFNITRRIIGFDTFDGFPSVHEKDHSDTVKHAREGAFRVASYDELSKLTTSFHDSKSVHEIPTIHLVRGDALNTIPDYIKSNPHLVVSLLNLDFDLYEPTKSALLHLVPRMPKGAVIVFDELNHNLFPGETVAVMETLGISELRLERFSFDTSLSFAVLE